MKILLVSSDKDTASINLKEELLKEYQVDKLKNNLYKINLDSINEIYLKEINQLHIFSKQEDICKEKEFDIIIFLSKHSTLSEKKPRCMTVHAIGNWGKAELGGKDRCVVKTDPILIRKLLVNLKEKKPIEIKEYEVKQEATHHGPFLEDATFFYEIGSDKKDWENKMVAKHMIKTLIDTIKNYSREETKNKNSWVEAVGVGGSHYCTRFNRLTFNKSNKFCFGHVVANYGVKEVSEDEGLLKQALEKSNASKIIYKQDV